MRSNKMALALGMAMVVCGCKQQAAAPDVAAPQAAAAAIPAETQDAGDAGDDASAPAFKKSDGYKMGAAMAAIHRVFISRPLSGRGNRTRPAR